MAVKYTIPFKAHDNISWRIDIFHADYSGEPISVRGVSEQAGVLAYAGNTDDPFSVFIKSTLTINCYNEGQIDINELQRAADKDFIIYFYRESFLKWQGYLTPGGISRTMKAPPYNLQLSAICGLAMLDDMPYIHADLSGTTFEISHCPINYVRQILFSNLGIVLPIRWTNHLQCTAFLNQDVFTGGVQWAVDGQGYNSYQTSDTGDVATTQKCTYILQGILQAMQCRIFQSNGMWVIRRIPEIVGGNAAYKQIPGNLGILSIQSATESLLQQIGRSGYRFVSEDQVITSEPGLKSCTVTYKANVRDNKLPNGSQDIVTPNTEPLDWGFYEETNVNYISVPAIDLRNGYATEILHTDVGNGYYTLKSESGTLGNDGLPIDTQTLIKQINFGFIFSPTDGFPVDGSGFIIWDTKPLQIQIIFNVGVIKYYLNEFGFWQVTPTTINIVVDGLQLDDVAKVDFDKFQGIIMPTPAAQPVAGDTSDIEVIFLIQGTQQYIVDNIYVTFEDASDVYESSLNNSKNTLTDTRELSISTSFGGYMISNFMSNWSTSDTECFFKDALAYEGTLTGLTANAIMRFRYKSSLIYNGSMEVRNGDWSFDEIYLIDSFDNSKFLPINASYNVEKCQVNGLVAMECRNDFVSLTEKYYSSNDNQLSN